MQARVAALVVAGTGKVANSFGRFVDKDFPAADESLLSPQDRASPSFQHHQDSAKWDEICGRVEWTRAPSSARVFGQDGVGTAGDIQQGGLGDCWLLAAAGTLAQKEKVLKRIIPERDSWKDGRYEVHVTKNGLPTTVVVDDQFPCLPGRDFKPAFARLSKDQELWPLILEKAWAKLHGSYARIEGGYSFNAFRDLTGAPGEKVPTTHPKFFEKLLEATSEGWLLSASTVSKSEIATKFSVDPKMWARRQVGMDVYFKQTGSGGFQAGKLVKVHRSKQGASFDVEVTEGPMKGAIFERVEKIVPLSGLVGNHAYTVLAAKEVEDEEGKVHRLIKIRNPHGHNEWHGRWSDDDTRWTPKMKRAVGHESKDDGVFWMSPAEFVKLFHEVNICRVKDDWLYTAISGTFSRDPAFHTFEVEVADRTHVYLNASQMCKRMLPNDSFEGKSGYQYRVTSLAVLSLDEPSLPPVLVHPPPLYTAPSKRVRDHWMSVTLDKGRYAVAVIDESGLENEFIPVTIKCDGFPNDYKSFNGVYERADEDIYKKRITKKRTGSAKLVVGSRCLARWKGGRDWYPATVSKLAPNKSYDIAYDDGDQEHNVPAKFVRARGDDEEHTLRCYETDYNRTGFDSMTWHFSNEDRSLKAFGLQPAKPWLQRQMEKAARGEPWSPVGRETLLLYDSRTFNFDSCPKAFLNSQVQESYKLQETTDTVALNDLDNRRNVDAWALTAYSNKAVTLHEPSEAAKVATARYKQLWHPQYTSGTGRAYKWKKATRDSQTTTMETMAHRKLIDEYAYLRAQSYFKTDRDAKAMKKRMAKIRERLQKDGISPSSGLLQAQPTAAVVIPLVTAAALAAIAAARAG